MLALVASFQVMTVMSNASKAAASQAGEICNQQQQQNSDGVSLLQVFQHLVCQLMHDNSTATSMSSSVILACSAFISPYMGADCLVCSLWCNGLRSVHGMEGNTHLSKSFAVH